MFERLSAEPIYNTRAVVHRTGVPADTFRAWERRYGVPTPLRTEGNQRLYSERDIRTITWLREQTAVGLTISQAILLMRSSKQPYPVTASPPKPVVDHDIEDVLAGKRSALSDPLVTARRRLLDAFMQLDGHSAERILQETYAWADLELVLVELLHAAILEVQDRPELLPPFSPVFHFARSFVFRKFASLYNLSNPNDGRGPILATAVEGEDHDLTLLLSVLFLSRAGFRTVFLGPSLPAEAFISAVRIVRPAVICLAAATEASVETLRDWQCRLATHADGSGVQFDQIPICYTGRVFVEKPELRAQVHGRFLGRAAKDSVGVVEAAMEHQRS